MGRLTLNSLVGRRDAGPPPVGEARSKETIGKPAGAIRPAVKTSAVAAKPPAAAPASTAATTAPTAGDLGSIRDILLGSMPQDYERHIQRLEARAAEQASLLRLNLQSFDERLEKRLADLENRSRTANGELREQLHEQMRAVNEALEACHGKAMRRIEQGLEEIQSLKLDRASFSNFLGSLSRQLTHEEAASDAAEESR